MEASKYSLADVIKMAIESDKVDNHTALPAEIVSYDSAMQTCSASISINRVSNGEIIVLPVLSGIPVVFPRNSSAGFTFPLVKGDGVLIIFSERNLDKWKTFGPGEPPVDARKFDLSDAIAVPGLNPIAGIMVPPPVEATEVRGEKLFIGDPLQFTTPIITTGALPGTPVGKPVMVPPVQLDILNIISSLIDLVDGALYGVPGPTGGGGGVDPETATALAGLKSDLSNLMP
jgi:hypothetical protein